MLDALARSRDVRGPYNIASYLKDVAGYEVSGQAVSKYLYGESWPRHAFMVLSPRRSTSPLRSAASWCGFVPMVFFRDCRGQDTSPAG